jgi:hypothetical protein
MAKLVAMGVVLATLLVFGRFAAAGEPDVASPATPPAGTPPTTAAGGGSRAAPAGLSAAESGSLRVPAGLSAAEYGSLWARAAQFIPTAQCVSRTLPISISQWSPGAGECTHYAARAA